MLCRSTLLATFFALTSAGGAAAGDLTVFAAQTNPSGLWKPGFGATLGAGILGLGAVEAEAARFSTDTEGGDMTSFTFSAMLAPPIGPVVPFAGVGIGVYRQNLGAANTTDLLRSLAVGVKLNIGRVFVIRGEYRRLDLSGPVLIQTDSRVSIGAGIQF